MADFDSPLGTDQFSAYDASDDIYSGSAYSEFHNLNQRKSLDRDATMANNYARKQYDAGIGLGWGHGRENLKKEFQPPYPTGDALFENGAYNATASKLPKVYPGTAYETFSSNPNTMVDGMCIMSNHIIIILIIAFVIFAIIAAVIIGKGITCIKKLTKTLMECHRTIQTLKSG